MFLSENYKKSGRQILEHSDLPKIEDNYKKASSHSYPLENQEKHLQKTDKVSLEEMHL